MRPPFGRARARGRARLLSQLLEVPCSEPGFGNPSANVANSTEVLDDVCHAAEESWGAIIHSSDGVRITAPLVGADRPRPAVGTLVDRLAGFGDSGLRRLRERPSASVLRLKFVA